MTEFAREKLIRGGLPAARIHLKPNFVADPGPVPGSRGTSALFVGRLSTEKGVRSLLDAWRTLPTVPLRIVGGGPLEEELRRTVASTADLRHVEILGRQPQEEVLRLMREAGLLVFPSECYGGALARVVLEAFACGLPVIGSRLGAMTELPTDGRMVRLFTPGDAPDLARCVTEVMANGTLGEMGREARAEYERRYAPAANLSRLIQLYTIARARRHSTPGRGALATLSSSR
jgi:glycosyltransferase involved in cell wall biosynthesis